MDRQYKEVKKKNDLPQKNTGGHHRLLEMEMREEEDFPMEVDLPEDLEEEVIPQEEGVAPQEEVADLMEDPG